MKSYQQLFAELKRRHVFRVAAIYGIVSFGVLQAADLMLPRLGLPDWTVTFMVAIVVLAFPVVLIIAWAFEVTPDGVRKTDAATPGELERLAAAPASQRWPAGLLALVGVAALVAGAWWVGRQGAHDEGTADGLATGATAGDDPAVRLAYSSPDEDTRPSLAVLPFADMSAEGDQQYFSDGMTEEILNTLAKIRELRVAARTSAFAFRGRDLDMRAIGDSLDVAYLIEGSVRKDGDRLRITTQLIDAADGSHLWSESYNRTLDDVFAIQQEIAEAIASELRVSLGLDDPSELVNPTADLEAYDLYLAGRSHMRRRGVELLEARRLFEAAISRDSTWAPAWAALAEVLEVSIWYPEALEASRNDKEAIARFLAAAERAARRALDLDPRTASAYVALGSVQRDRGQWAAADQSYRMALDLDRDLAEVQMQYAELLMMVGRVAEAVTHADRAVALDPAPVRFMVLGWALFLDDRRAEAAEVFRLGAERDVDRSRPDLWILAGDAYLAAGESQRAIDVYTRGSGAGFAMDRVETSLNISALTASELQSYVDGIASGNLRRILPSVRRLLTPEQWLLVGETDTAIARVIQFSDAGPSGDVAWDLWSPPLDAVRDEPRMRDLLASRDLTDARLQRTPPAERRRPSVLGSAP